MFEYMIAVETKKMELERLESKIARRYQAEVMRVEEKNQLLTTLAMTGSHALQNLGNALISAGERLNDGRTSGRAAAV